MRISAEVFPPGVFIQEECDAREWTIVHLASLMEGDKDLNELALSLLVYTPQKGLLLSKKISTELGRIFDVHQDFFLNLDVAWQKEN